MSSETLLPLTVKTISGETRTLNSDDDWEITEDQETIRYYWEIEVRLTQDVLRQRKDRHQQRLAILRNEISNILKFDDLTLVILEYLQHDESVLSEGVTIVKTEPDTMSDWGNTRMFSIF